jgi:hypothetical protein
MRASLLRPQSDVYTEPFGRGIENMVQDLESIEYRRGLLERGQNPQTLPLKVWRGTNIPDEVRKAINEDDLLNLGGV